MDVHWKDEYATGHADMDKDHRTLVDILAVLATGYCEHDLVDSQIKMLERYVAGHFAREERLMTAGGFPDLAAHLEQHQHFRDDVRRMRQQWNAGDNPKLQAEIIDRLTHWLLEHIAVADRAYVPWIAGAHQP